jgi:hypothetical protein
MMKNSTNDGFDQHYKAQAAVEQVSLLIVAPSLSNHPVDTAEAVPLSGHSHRVGPPEAAAMDRNYFSPTTIKTLQAWGIEPYIATGREPHQHSWRQFFAQTPAPPPAEASLIVKMAYNLQTDIGRAVYRLRKCTSSRSSALSKRCWAFANSRCEA